MKPCCAHYLNNQTAGRRCLRKTARPGTPAFDAGAFQLVFLDMSLPDSWGLRRCGGCARVSDVPVVLMTGAVLPELAAEAPKARIACIFKHELDGQKLRDILDLCGDIENGPEKRMGDDIEFDFLTGHWGWPRSEDSLHFDRHSREPVGLEM